MLNYILKRLFLGILSFLILIIIVFFLLALIKASPIDKADYKTEEYLELLRKYDLDKNVAERFWIWFTGLFHGDLGNVYEPTKAGAQTIQEIFFGPLKYTITITIFAFIFGSILGIALGFWAGYRAGELPDIIINIFVVLFLAIPTFVMAIFFILIAPFINLPSGFLDWDSYGFTQSFASMLLPILVLTLSSVGSIAYFIRNEVKTILVSDYIMNARSKGLSEWTVFRKYVWRNALIPIVTFILPSFVVLLSGSVIIESIFGVPGTSSVIINAVRNSESDIIMFQLVFFGLLSMIFQLIVDVTYVFIDPRIKYSSATETKNLGILAYFRRLHNKYQIDLANRGKLKKKGGINEQTSIN